MPVIKTFNSGEQVFAEPSWGRVGKKGKYVAFCPVADTKEDGGQLIYPKYAGFKEGKAIYRGTSRISLDGIKKGWAVSIIRNGKTIAYFFSDEQDLQKLAASVFLPKSHSTTKAADATTTTTTTGTTSPANLLPTIVDNIIKSL